ncbi:MAG: AsmA family protein [Gammaproteobacteria bacterium]|nr:AsmA family protein [Gammaproteobacteria bacterium]MDD9895709.1 AsmA family protein [Gammaproteobacteria bacterium]MDD9960114.1 AsmA family protein [Gammaproteobacteria bacterium]
MNFKNFLKVLAGFVVVLLIAGFFLISSVNTERNKLAIQEAILAATGYELTIAGDMNVNLFPTLGLTLNDVRFRNPAFNQELASTSAAVLSADLRALLRGELYVRELSADDFHINIYTDSTGTNIWSVEDSSPETSSNQIVSSIATNTEEQDVVSVAFERIRIANASVDIQNVQQGLRYSINNLNFDSRDTNIDGRPFDVDLNFNFLNNGMSTPLPMSLRSTITADVNNGNVAIANINFAITPVLITGGITVSDFNENLSYEGALESNNFDVMGLLQTLGYVETPEEFSGEITATQDFGFNLELNGDATQLTVADFAATLGSTDIQASGDIRFATEFVPTNVRYDVITSSIDFSPFTPAQTEDEPAETAENDLAAAAPQPQRGNDIELPFDSLQSFNVLGSIAIESITANDLVIQDVNLFTNVEDGVLDIELQPTSLYNGTAQGLIRVDSRGDDAALETQLALNQLNIVEFAPAISRLNTVTGRLNVETAYAATGSTTNELLNSLNGSTSFAITENSVDIGVIKQVFTAIAALSPTGESIQQWPDVIQFGELGGYILLEDGITDNQEVQLRMDNVNVNGTGGIDLAAGSFDYDLEFAILGPPAAQTIPINELFHNVPWPVDCSARFADEVSQYCRPDFTRVREIFAQLGQNAIRNELQNRLIEQVPEDLEETARGLLRRILN